MDVPLSCTIFPLETIGFFDCTIIHILFTMSRFRHRPAKYIKFKPIKLKAQNSIHEASTQSASAPRPAISCGRFLRAFSPQSFLLNRFIGERLLYEKKRKIREALEEGKPIPTELRNEEAALRQEIDLEDEHTAVMHCGSDCSADSFPWRVGSYI
ncbi:hypothetical protein Pfo_019429 [Paulownia fortunei]|nr:hypothetical protein Pfo_019429 [Paulownia fortunei]